MIGKHITDSFDYFIHYELQNIIQNEMPLVITNDKKQICIDIRNAHFEPPTITPAEARLYNHSYLAPIYVDIDETITNDQGEVVVKHWPREILTHLPIPVHCSVCRDARQDMDYAGYFIIRGKERVLVSQLRMAYNTPIISLQNNIYTLEIRFCNLSNMHTTCVKLDYQNNDVFLSTPFLKERINIADVFTVLGYSDVTFKNTSWVHTRAVRRIKWLMQQRSRVEVLERVANQLKSFTGNITMAEKIICYELFPPIGYAKSFADRAQNVIILIDELLACVANENIIDRYDRDNLCNKRLEPAGILCAELFRQLFKKYILIMTREFSKKIINPNVKLFVQKYNIIGKRFLACFLNAAWGAQQNGYVRIGVSQILCNTNYLAILSHLQRVNIPVSKDTKNLHIRQIHPSHAFYLCGCESPEGSTIGLVLNMAVGCTISLRVSTTCLTEILLTNCIRETDTGIPAALLVNGIFTGTVPNVTNFVERFKQLRSVFIIPRDVSISYTDQYIMIWADEGRFLHNFGNDEHIDPLEK